MTTYFKENSMTNGLGGGAFEAVVMFLLILFLCCVIAVCSLHIAAGGDYGETNVVINTSLLLAPSICILILLRKKLPILQTPMGWFLISTSLFYGFGPLLYFFGNDETIASVEHFNPINQTDLFLVNVIVASSFVTVLVTYSFLLLISRHKGRNSNWTEIYRRITPETTDILGRGIKFLLILGLPIQFLVVAPSDLGINFWVYPGFLKYIGYCVYGALVPLFLLKDVRFSAKIQFYILVALLLLTGLMSLSKSLIFLIPMTIIIAMLFKEHDIKRIAFVSVCALILFILISPIILFGRILAGYEGEFNNQASVDSEMIMEIFSVAQASEVNEAAGMTLGNQAWWARLNYSNVQSFAINQYQKGDNGESLSNIFWIFIPRILYEDKPLLTDAAREFNGLIDGNYAAAHSPTFLVEGYWNYGWKGLLFCGFFLGLQFFAWRIYSDWLFSKLRVQYLPIWFTGIQIGFFQDGWLLVNCFGSLIVVLLLHYIIKLLFSLKLSRSIKYYLSEQK